VVQDWVLHARPNQLHLVVVQLLVRAHKPGLVEVFGSQFSLSLVRRAVENGLHVEVDWLLVLGNSITSVELLGLVDLHKRGSHDHIHRNHLWRVRILVNTRHACSSYCLLRQATEALTLVRRIAQFVVVVVMEVDHIAHCWLNSKLLLIVN